MKSQSAAPADLQQFVALVPVFPAGMQQFADSQAVSPDSVKFETPEIVDLSEMEFLTLGVVPVVDMRQEAHVAAGAVAERELEIPATAVVVEQRLQIPAVLAVVGMRSESPVDTGLEIPLVVACKGFENPGPETVLLEGLGSKTLEDTESGLTVSVGTAAGFVGLLVVSDGMAIVENSELASAGSLTLVVGPLDGYASVVVLLQKHLMADLQVPKRSLEQRPLEVDQVAEEDSWGLVYHTE